MTTNNTTDDSTGIETTPVLAADYDERLCQALKATEKAISEVSQEADINEGRLREMAAGTFRPASETRAAVEDALETNLTEDAEEGI